MPLSVLLTGASRGIGLATARHLAAAGCHVTGTSRRPERLDPAPAGIRWIALDLNDPDSVARCLEQAGPVDVLINNAGTSRLAPAEADPLSGVRDLFQTDLFGPMALVQGCLPHMRARGQGWIIQVGSLAGVFAVPFQSAYSAAKAALAAYTQSLRSEVRAMGIRVVLVCPNDIRTTIQPEVVRGPVAGYHAALERMQAVRAARMASAGDPQQVARRIGAILRRRNPAPVYAIGGGAPLLLFARRWLPDRWVESLIRRTYQV